MLVSCADWQRINSAASVFSAALPAMLATTASSALASIQSQPALFTALQSNIALFRQLMSKLEPLPIPEATSTNPSAGLTATAAPALIGSPPGRAPNKDAIIHIPSHPSSALIHIFLLNPPGTMEAEERMLQDVVDELLGKSDVIITRARRLRGQEAFEPEPSLKLCLSGALSRKETEKAAKGLKEALIKVCGSEFSRMGQDQS
jgi:serine palmitoyltransferase